jgi:probable O-glycosylation ligase (exosortase A-associated)
MRDLAVGLFIVAALPSCFRRPFIGLLLFSLLAYMRLQDLTWGWARDQRWSYYVALVTLVGFLFSRQPDKRFFRPDLRCWVMIALALLVGLSLLFSANLRPHDFENYTEYCKIIGVALFTTAIVKSREHLRILVWVIALCFGFFGVKSGLSFLLHGGGLVILQGPGGMLIDNNDFALALCMAIPMLLHLGLSERRPLLRRTVLAMVPLTVMTIVATHSRGGFLALAVTAVALAWRSRNRVGAFALLGLCFVGGLLLAPRSYIERLSTISAYESEGSAKGRLEAWGVAFHMIQSKPLLGVGYEKFQENYRRYDPRATTAAEGGPGTRVTHNSYLEIWAECGTPAFLLYLTLFAWSFFDLWRLRREAAARYHASWILSYATMFEATLAAFAVGSLFLNRAHFDLFYHLVAIVLVFSAIARASMRDESSYPQRERVRGRLAFERARGFGARTRERGFERARRGPAFGS